MSVDNAAQFPSISDAGYKSLCQFCDEATTRPFTPELSRLVDAALLLIHYYEERRGA